MNKLNALLNIIVFFIVFWNFAISPIYIVLYL